MDAGWKRAWQAVLCRALLAAVLGGSAWWLSCHPTVWPMPEHRFGPPEDPTGVATGPGVEATAKFWGQTLEEITESSDR